VDARSRAEEILTAMAIGGSATFAGVEIFRVSATLWRVNGGRPQERVSTIDRIFSPVPPDDAKGG
jgi:hypothetical protein